MHGFCNWGFQFHHRGGVCMSGETQQLLGCTEASYYSLNAGVPFWLTDAFIIRKLELHACFWWLLTPRVAFGNSRWPEDSCRKTHCCHELPFTSVLLCFSLHHANNRTSNQIPDAQSNSKPDFQSLLFQWSREIDTHGNCRLWSPCWNREVDKWPRSSMLR